MPLCLRLLQEVGMQRKIQVLPTVEAWRGGECMDTVKGGEAAKVLQMLDEHIVVESMPSPDPEAGAGRSTTQPARAVIVAGIVCVLGEHKTPPPLFICPASVSCAVQKGGNACEHRENLVKGFCLRATGG
jgi:hypothetical protein